ncbi:mitochondrial 54S ribosomal protein uL23m [Lodderomyces beijingensis]|uniref:Large ribosomal subunit protein uL23m n=1 Tax=Lodderomyces beijingensis TaxID=1775926 RepID=A0ABP0ZKT6_9ASCO
MDFKTPSSMISSISKVFARARHFRPRARDYPKVNVKEVELNPRRYGFRKIRPPILAQSKTKTLFPNSELAKLYVEHGKRIPNRFMSQMDSGRARAYFEEFQQRIMMDEPHFTVGKKQIFLPQGRVCLLRNNAKHTPYQAKFLVPKSMNKMDLRDYLWHIYGLRALNVTVQLQPATWARGPNDHGRYRQPQLKKMTIDMAEPFVWPEVSKEQLDKFENQAHNSIEQMEDAYAVGSDKNKPNEIYDGMFKEDAVVKRFIPTQFKRTNTKATKQLQQSFNVQETRNRLARHLNL